MRFARLWHSLCTVFILSFTLFSCGGSGAKNEIGTADQSNHITSAKSGRVNGVVAQAEGITPHFEFHFEDKLFIPNSFSQGQGQTGADFIPFTPNMVNGTLTENAKLYLLGKYYSYDTGKGYDSLFAGGSFFGAYYDEDVAYAFYDFLTFGDIDPVNAHSNEIAFSGVKYYSATAIAGEGIFENRGTGRVIYNAASQNMSAELGNLHFTGTFQGEGIYIGEFQSDTGISGKFHSQLGDNTQHNVITSMGGFAGDNGSNIAISGAWWGTLEK